jgi:predicted alpha/beta superfamily hydrolase
MATEQTQKKAKSPAECNGLFAFLKIGVRLEKRRYPSVWWNRGYLVGQAEKKLRIYTGLGKTLYVGSSRDSEKIAESRRLAAVLQDIPKSKLTWHYQPLPEETHATIYHPAALHAFRTVFQPKQRPTSK